MIALRERNFRLYWLGQAISNIGNWMQVVALGWFIAQTSASPVALGLLGLAQFVPLFALSLPGGALADRFQRLHLLIVTQSAAMILACVLAALAWSGNPPLWSLLLVAALAASVTAIDNPARQALLSDLVSKEALLNAVALNSSVYNGAAVIGPSLAGLLLVGIGAAGCFLVNAVSFLAVILALLLIARNRTGKRAEAPPVDREPRASVSAGLSSTLRGFAALRNERTLPGVLGVAAVASLLGRPYLLLLPAFARSIQHVGPQGLGMMVAASGLGSFLGALLLAMLKSSQHLTRMLLLCGVGFGLALSLFAVTPAFLLAVLFLLGCGAGATMTMMVANTLLQTRAPSGMRGRVMSLYTLIAAGFTQLGALLVSGLGTVFGLGNATLIMGIGVALLVIVGYPLFNARG